MLFNAFLAIVLRTYLAWENKKMDAKFGAVEKGVDGKTGPTGIENDGPKFRYIL
jgi:hypothetical protein